MIVFFLKDLVRDVFYLYYGVVLKKYFLLEGLLIKVFLFLFFDKVKLLLFDSKLK